MSDNYIHIIPEQAGFVPEEARRQEAVSYFREIGPKADEITASVTTNLQFIDCGQNFEEIRCPSCKAVVQLKWWQEWMNEDFSKKDGFILRQRKMPCCGARSTLHELAYDWPQGFARCDIRAMNPNFGKLSATHRTRFETILGCPVRAIYGHI